MAKIRREKKRSCWTHSWIMRCDDRSMSNTLVREVAVENDAEYRAVFRMEEADFDYLLNLVSPLIAKQDTLLQTSISVRECRFLECLEVTLSNSWLPIMQQGNHGHSADAKHVCNTYRTYFSGVGQVLWQKHIPETLMLSVQFS